MLTCKYRADIISVLLSLMLRTPNFSCVFQQQHLSSDGRARSCTNVERNGVITYRKEVGFVHQPEEYDGHHSKIASESNAGSKDFLQLPAIWQWRWLHSILGDCHDCA